MIGATHSHIHLAFPMYIHSHFQLCEVVDSPLHKKDYMMRFEWEKEGRGKFAIIYFRKYNPSKEQNQTYATLNYENGKCVTASFFYEDNKRFWPDTIRPLSFNLVNAPLEGNQAMKMVEVREWSEEEYVELIGPYVKDAVIANPTKEEVIQTTLLLKSVLIHRGVIPQPEKKKEGEGEEGGDKAEVISSSSSDPDQKEGKSP